jgi:uncharacterized membrane protein YhhN
VSSLARGLLVLTFAVAVVDWVAVAVDARRRAGGSRDRSLLEYIAKPATMVALLAFLLALTAGGPQSRLQVLMWSLAIVFSLAGDVFLMLPRDLFIPGLASFLAAHVFVTAIPLARSVLGGIAAAGERAAVAAYMVVITVMVLAAWTLPWQAGVPLWAGVAGAVGATLFFASDAMIGRRRFVADFAGSDLAIIVTYHLGQIGLALSLVR